ncbi:MAG: beta-galactosidase [Ardenticatenales bacterium]|nr:beta-galactosidase [Ardenticatenales bacterium]
MMRLLASARPFRRNLLRPAALVAGAVVSAALVACNGDAKPPTAEPAGGLPTPTLVVRGGAPSGDATVVVSGSTGEMDDVPRRTSPVVLGSPEYAVQGFLWWRPEVAERDLLIAKDMGFTWVKQMFSWRDIETEKGKFDWSKADHIVRKSIEYQDIHLLIRLDFQPEWARSGCSDQGPPNDPQDYFDYVGAVAARYRGQVAAYQIWNEPNLAREWCDQAPDPAAYAALLKGAYAAIKAADPTAYVISAGLSPTGTQPPEAYPDDDYLDRLYTAMGGDSAGYFDILGVHAAGFAAPPETSPDEAAANPAFGGERFFTFRRVEDMRAIMTKYGDDDARMAILEMGWTSDTIHDAYKWHAVSEETKADYLVRAYQYAKANWSPWMTIMSTIYLCNADWTKDDEQYWWCVNDPEGTPRPAFNALKAMPK